MRCISIWGHKWVDIPITLDSTYQRVCRKCGLIQTLREFGYVDYRYVDVGYAENVDELITLALEQKAESRWEATHKKQVKERNIRETLIPTRELVKQELKEEQQ